MLRREILHQMHRDVVLLDVRAPHGFGWATSETFRRKMLRRLLYQVFDARITQEGQHRDGDYRYYRGEPDVFDGLGERMVE